jgi:hypothetical protein
VHSRRTRAAAPNAKRFVRRTPDQWRGCGGTGRFLRVKVETAGIEPASCSVQARGAHPGRIPHEVRTGGVEPPQPEATRLQRAGLTCARHPHERATGRIRTGAAGFTVPGASRLHHGHREAGTTGLEPATSRLTSDCSSAAELRPLGTARGRDSNPRLELMRLARKAPPPPRTKVWPAGVEPAVSGSRNRRGGRLPHSQTKHPRRDSNPQLPD